MQTSDSASFDLTYLERITNSALLCYGTHEGSLTDRRQELAACLVALATTASSAAAANNNDTNSSNSARTTPRPSQTTNFQLPSMLLDDESVVRELSTSTMLVRKCLSTILMCEEARSIFRKEPHSFLRGPTLASAVIDRYFTVHLKTKLCSLVEPLVHQIFSIDVLPEELESASSSSSSPTTSSTLTDAQKKDQEEKCVEAVRQQICYAMRTLMRIIDTCQWPDGLRLALGDLQDFMVVARYYDEHGGGEARAVRSGELEKDFSARLASIVALHMLSPLLFSPWSMTIPANPSALQFAVTDDSHTPVKYYNQEQRDRLRKRLLTFYSKHYSEGAANVEKALSMTVTEKAMFTKICAKYKVDPATEKKESSDNGTLPSWLKQTSSPSQAQQEDQDNNKVQITPATAPQSTNTSVAPSQNSSPQPSNNRNVTAGAEENNNTEINQESSPSKHRPTPLNSNAISGNNNNNETEDVIQDPVQNMLDEDSAAQQEDSSLTTAAAGSCIKSNSSISLAESDVKNSNSSSNLKGGGAGGATGGRSRDNSMHHHPNAPSPAPQNQQQQPPSGEEMMKRRRRLALFVKILQKAANNSTFDIPPSIANDPQMMALPLASTDPQFLCRFNTSLKTEFGQELRRSLRSIPIHWNDYITSEGEDVQVISGGLATANTTTTNNGNKTAESNNNDNNNNNNNTTSESATGGSNGNLKLNLQASNSGEPTPSSSVAKEVSGVEQSSRQQSRRPSTIIKRSRSFMGEHSPARKSKVEKRLKCLVQEDICQAITATQGLLPQFPFFEERYRSRLDLWNLPLSVPALAQTELDAMSPFTSEVAAVVGISSSTGKDSDNDGGDGSSSGDDISSEITPSNRQIDDASSNVSGSASMRTALEEGRRAVASAALNPEYFFITQYPLEHPCHSLNNSAENLRPLHADLLQIIRFHPPHVMVVHGELLVRLENKIKGDGSFLSSMNNNNNNNNTTSSSSNTPAAARLNVTGASSSSNKKDSIAISLPDCERAIEAHFAARLEVIATRRNRKTGVAVIFLTPNTAGKWGSHWFSKHVLKVMPSHLIENISRYFVVKPTFMARTKAWKNSGTGTEDAQMIDSAMCMVDKIEDVHPLLFAPKENHQHLFSGGTTGSPMFGAGGSSILSPTGNNNNNAGVMSSPLSATSNSTTSTIASPASPAAGSSSSAPSSGQTVWLTLPPNLMPEVERGFDPAAAVVRLYRGSITLLETLRSIPRARIATYLLDRSGVASSPAGPLSPSTTAFPPTGGGGRTTSLGPNGAPPGNNSQNNNSSNDLSHHHQSPGKYDASNPLSPGSQAAITDPKATSEMAKKLRDQWVCTAARCSVHLEYYDQSPSVVQSLGSLLFDVVLDRFFSSAFGCFSKESLVTMAELFFCVDGSKQELLHNGAAASSSSASPSQSSSPNRQPDGKGNNNNTTTASAKLPTPAERVPACSIVFRGAPLGLMSGSTANNNNNQSEPGSPLRLMSFRASEGSDGSTTSDALALWAAPGGVQRVMKYVRESLLVYPYRGTSAANSATTNNNSENSTTPSSASTLFSPQQIKTPPPFNSMQSAIILALAESIIPHSATTGATQVNVSSSGVGMKTGSDVISLIHNVLFSPRDAMLRMTRDVVHPLLATVFAANNVPEAHGESLRMATESLTRCIATAVARASLSVKNYGPASDWLELAIACALPRIAIDRRRAGSAMGGAGASTSGNMTNNNNNNNSTTQGGSGGVPGSGKEAPILV